MKKWLVILAVLALVGASSLVALSYAQYSSTQGMGRQVELIPPTSIWNAGIGLGSTPNVAPRAHGVDVKFNKKLMGLIQISSAPQNGTLWVYFQSSADNGQTWNDFASYTASFASFTNTMTVCVPLALADPSSATWPVIPQTNSDGSLAGNNINQWGIGRRIRAKWATGWNNHPGSWTFHVAVIPD